MTTSTASTTATSVAAGRLAVEPAVYVPPRSSRGLWRDAWRRLLRNKLAMAGLVVIGCMLLIALVADLLPLPDPTFQFPNSSYARPSAAHWLGADELGRDLLSRLVLVKPWIQSVDGGPLQITAADDYPGSFMLDRAQILPR